MLQLEITSLCLHIFASCCAFGHLIGVTYLLITVTSSALPIHYFLRYECALHFGQVQSRLRRVSPGMERLVRLVRIICPLVLLVSLSCMAMSKAHFSRPIKPTSLIPFSTPTLAHNSRFFPMEEARCSAFLPPRLVVGRDADVPRTVVVDFIVGRDGNVEKPVILESQDPTFDPGILDIVRGWHYRPALCDGLPIDAEGRIQLGSSQSRN